MEPVEEYQTPKSVITPLGKVDSPYRRRFSAPPPTSKKCFCLFDQLSVLRVYTERQKENKVDLNS